MAWVSNGVNGRMSIKLKTNRKYFMFANLEGTFLNNMKKPWGPTFKIRLQRRRANVRILRLTGGVHS